MSLSFSGLRKVGLYCDFSVFFFVRFTCFSNLQDASMPSAKKQNE